MGSLSQNKDFITTAGHHGGPTYFCAERRADGTWLAYARHQDRGELRTDERVYKRKPDLYRFAWRAGYRVS